jgi:hypothetical protein
MSGAANCLGISTRTKNGLTPNMSGGFGVAKPPRRRPLDGLVRPHCVLARERAFDAEENLCALMPSPLDVERQCERTGLAGQQGVHQRRVHDLAEDGNAATPRMQRSGGSLPAAGLVAPHERTAPNLLNCNVRCADRQRTGSPLGPAHAWQRCPFAPRFDATSDRPNARHVGRPQEHCRPSLHWPRRFVPLTATPTRAPNATNAASTSTGGSGASQ